MGRPTAQAQSAIDALKQAGFNRSDFSVRTKRIWHTDSEGRQFYEYGDAQIYIYAARDRQLELLPNMLWAGLNCTLPYYLASDGQKKAGPPIVDNQYQPGNIGLFIIWDDTESDPMKRYQRIKLDDPRHPLCNK